MAKQKKVVVNGNEFVLQSVSPRWYFDLNDRCGMTGGKRKTAEYIDELFKNVVIDPIEAYLGSDSDLQIAGRGES